MPEFIKKQTYKKTNIKIVCPHKSASWYSMFILISLILSNVFDHLEKNLKDMVEEIDKEFKLELEHEKSTEGLHLQYVYEEETHLFDAMLSLVLKFWRDIKDKKFSLCIINKKLLSFSKYRDQIQLLVMISQHSLLNTIAIPEDLFIIENLKDQSETELFALIKEKCTIWEHNLEMFLYEPGYLLKDKISLTKLFDSKCHFAINNKNIEIFIAWQKSFKTEPIISNFIDHLVKYNLIDITALSGCYIILNSIGHQGHDYTLDEYDIKQKNLFDNYLARTKLKKIEVQRERKHMEGFPVTTNFIISYNKTNIKLSVYDKSCKSTFDFIFDMTEFQYEPTYLIEMSLLFYDKKNNKDGKAFFAFALTDKSTVYGNFTINKFVLFEHEYYITGRAYNYVVDITKKK